MASLGPLIQALRKESGLSQRVVADHLGIDFTYVSKIENDRLEYPCSDALLRGMADLYKADADELIALAGRVPQDIIDRLRGDIDAIRAVRKVLTP